MPIPEVLVGTGNGPAEVGSAVGAASQSPGPDESAAGGDGLFEMLNRLLGSGEELLLRAAPVIGAAALIWLAVEVRFAMGRVILVALAVLLMVAFTRNIVEGCDLIAREIIGPEATCRRSARTP